MLIDIGYISGVMSVLDPLVAGELVPKNQKKRMNATYSASISIGLIIAV